MAVTKAQRKRSPKDTEPGGLDLTVVVQTRISSKAAAILGERADAAGVKNATWIRMELYKALGLSPGDLS